ncbi:hypothetical protein MMC25_004205 [Agyrium rufum]|nr:hypothetical protein [Agyrium rufum]
MADDEAAENIPFIEQHDGSFRSRYSIDASILTGDLNVGDAAPTTFVWALTATAGISGFLFGYDTGVISSTLVSIGPDLSNKSLSTLDKSLITSCTSLFALIASPITGILADRYGRKRVITIADVLFAIGALAQAMTTTTWGMIFGRSVVGLAVGAASLVVPLYISELSPSAYRGRLVTLSILLITFGQMIAYIIGWALSSTPHGWRWMVGIGAAPAVVQLSLLFFMPETPRWLLRAGHTQAAHGVLSKVYGKDARGTIETVMRAIDFEILAEEDQHMDLHLVSSPSKRTTSSFLSVSRARLSQLMTEPSNRLALAIACLLQGLQQLCGFNSLLYFSATIFSLLSFRSPTLPSLSIATTNFVFTLIALFLIDRIGRRRILLYSVPFMAVALFIAGFAFVFLPLEESSPSRREPSIANDLEALPKWPPIVILFSMTLYVSFYALGIGNVPWQQSELFHLNVRSLGSSIATATNWGCNFVVGITFLPMMDWWSPTGTFVVYGVVCILGWVAVWWIYPEMKGMGLEDGRGRRGTVKGLDDGRGIAGDGYAVDGEEENAVGSRPADDDVERRDYGDIDGDAIEVDYPVNENGSSIHGLEIRNEG